jgi:uncharacterized membrane protein YuzA (DUF378 family)
MKAFNLVTLVLTILAGLDLGILGLTGADVIGSVFGVATSGARVVDVILGLSALYQLYPFFKALSVGEIRAEVSRS